MAPRLVKTLSFGAYEQLSLLLKPVKPGKDWRSLADLMGFSNEEIIYLQEESEPVILLMRKWVTRKQEGATTEKLTKYLKKLKRLDVIEDLRDYFDQALTIDEYRKKEKESQMMPEAEIDDSPATLNDSYDVFISYAAADVEFAKEIVSQLESNYNIRVCINFRDFLPGPHALEQIVEVIEQRCRKVIAVLSESYVKCEDCDYQAKVAMTLSPGCKRRVLIPVLYERCSIPSIMRGIFFLNYTDEDYRVNFWDKLSRAVKGKGS